MTKEREVELYGHWVNERDDEPATKEWRKQKLSKQERAYINECDTAAGVSKAYRIITEGLLK